MAKAYPGVSPMRELRNSRTFFGRFTVPEEDRHLYTSAPWDGGFRRKASTPR
jgi:hypothetical protein